MAKTLLPIVGLSLFWHLADLNPEVGDVGLGAQTRRGEGPSQGLLMTQSGHPGLATFLAVRGGRDSQPRRYSLPRTSVQ